MTQLGKLELLFTLKSHLHSRPFPSTVHTHNINDHAIPLFFHFSPPFITVKASSLSPFGLPLHIVLRHVKICSPFNLIHTKNRCNYINYAFYFNFKNKDKFFLIFLNKILVYLIFFKTFFSFN